MKIPLIAILFALFELAAPACLWDTDTLSDELQRSPDRAKVIFGEAAEPPDAPRLHERIAKLKAEPRENDPAWWNELAGAHIRLGETGEAASMLEPIVKKFPNDYGVHANLGTAYHLLGRYRDAEKEIARDLEINPDAHFGLEKYHFALLQYLMRDQEYQKNHLYVDEFSETALSEKWSSLSLMSTYRIDSGEFLIASNSTGNTPSYRSKWNLAADTNLQSGVLYMATLNPREPACFAMLGVACLVEHGRGRDLNLAIAAFQKAIHLGSPQADVLEQRIRMIREHLSDAHGRPNARRIISLNLLPALAVLAACALLAGLIIRRTRARRRS